MNGANVPASRTRLVEVGDGAADVSEVRGGPADAQRDGLPGGAGVLSGLQQCVVGHRAAAQLAGLAAWVFLRGFVIVALVSLNTRQIAQGRYESAFVVGGLISAMWWSNSSAKREQFKGAGALYALGAACGTVVGMWVGR